VASDIASPPGQAPRYSHVQQNGQINFAPPINPPPAAQQQLFGNMTGAAQTMYDVIQQPAGQYSTNASPAHQVSSYATSDPVSLHTGAPLMHLAYTCTLSNQAFRLACTLIA
jgi:hypothetical protein